MTGPRTLLAGVAAATLVAAGPAPAQVAPGHGGSLDTGGMSERQLRASETQVLGPEHAAEHARMRAAIRSGRFRVAAAAPPRAEAAVSNPLTDGKWTSHFPIPVIG